MVLAYITVIIIGAIIGGTIGYIRKKKQIEKEQSERLKFEMFLAAMRTVSEQEYTALVTTFGSTKARDIIVQNYKIKNGLL